MIAGKEAAGSSLEPRRALARDEMSWETGGRVPGVVQKRTSPSETCFFMAQFVSDGAAGFGIVGLLSFGRLLVNLCL